MAYSSKKVKKLNWDEVKVLIKTGSIVGCFKLYGDNTEALIEDDYDLDDLVKHHESGGEFGMERSDDTVSKKVLSNDEDMNFLQRAYDKVNLINRTQDVLEHADEMGFFVTESDARVIAKRFLSDYDCNRDENSMLEEQIRNYFKGGLNDDNFTEGIKEGYL